eukprot:m.193519 g.193519  ORF g.193519 m.193519 type:complete len:136 (+) comp53686_c5_seq17:369-776(+)
MMLKSEYESVLQMEGWLSSTRNSARPMIGNRKEQSRNADSVGFGHVLSLLDEISRCSEDCSPAQSLASVDAKRCFPVLMRGMHSERVRNTLLVPNNCAKRAHFHSPSSSQIPIQEAKCGRHRKDEDACVAQFASD